MNNSIRRLEHFCCAAAAALRSLFFEPAEVVRTVGAGDRGHFFNTLGVLGAPLLTRAQAPRCSHPSELVDVMRPKTSQTDFHDWDALAEEALKAARQMPKGPERIEASKQAGRLRMAADRKGVKLAPLGRPPAPRTP